MATNSHTWKNNDKNIVGIIVDTDLKLKIVSAKRTGDKIITNKLVLEEDVIHIISSYALKQD